MIEDMDDYTDPVEQAYYTRLAATVRPKDLKVSIKYGQEGPDHDPYGWREISVSFDDRKVMYREAMLSERLVIEGPVGKVEFNSPDYDQNPPMETMFEDFVGFPIEQLDYWCNEDWWADDEVREAELAAGWDSSP